MNDRDEWQSYVTQAILYAVGVAAVLLSVLALWHNILTYNPFR